MGGREGEKERVRRGREEGREGAGNVWAGGKQGRGGKGMSGRKGARGRVKCGRAEWREGAGTVWAGGRERQ